MEIVNIGEQPVISITTINGRVLINPRHLVSIGSAPPERVMLESGDYKVYQPEVAVLTLASGERIPSEDDDLLEMLGLVENENKRAPTTPPVPPPVPAGSPPPVVSAPEPKKKRKWLP